MIKGAETLFVISEPRLFKLVLGYRGKAFTYDVRLWRGYGATIPGLATTNGSIDYVARFVSERVRNDNWTIEESVLDARTDFADCVSLRAAIQEAWDVFNQKV